jgi:hypothetical protein
VSSVSSARIQMSRRRHREPATAPPGIEGDLPVNCCRTPAYGEDCQRKCCPREGCQGRESWQPSSQIVVTPLSRFCNSSSFGKVARLPNPSPWQPSFWVGNLPPGLATWPSSATSWTPLAGAALDGLFLSGQDQKRISRDMPCFGNGKPQKPNRRLVGDCLRLPVRAIPKIGRSVDLTWPQNPAQALSPRPLHEGYPDRRWGDPDRDGLDLGGGRAPGMADAGC